jgi:hypothetical protein
LNKKPKNSLTRTGAKNLCHVGKEEIMCQWKMDKCQKVCKTEKEMYAHYYDDHYTDEEPIPLHI